MDFKNILHNKLFLYGAGAVALFVLVRLIMSGASGSSGTVTTVTNQPTDAQVQAQTSLAIAQIGAATQVNAGNLQLAAQTQALQEQLAEKGIDADVAKYSISTQYAAQTMQIQAAAAAQERDDNLQASIAKWTLDQATASQVANNNFQLAYAANANSTAIATAQIIAGVNLASIQANRDVTIAGFQEQAATTASIINGQVAMNDSNNAVQIARSNNDTRAAINKNNTSVVGGIVGGILGIFSDRRLKRDVILLGREADGLGRYAYRYHGDPSYQVGVMADEVRRIRPAAIGSRVKGYDTVRYAAL